MARAGCKAIFGLFALILAALPAFAQVDCRPATKTERDMAQCLQTMAKAQATEMAAAVRTLKARYADPSEKGFAPLIDKAQRAFSAWRDAECSFRTFESRQGTGYANILAACAYDLNGERLKTLKDMVDSP